MRDLHHPAPCPACRSRQVSTLHATRTALYVACAECGRTWHLDAASVDPMRRGTSAAFRMTARIVAHGAAPAHAD